MSIRKYIEKKIGYKVQKIDSKKIITEKEIIPNQAINFDKRSIFVAIPKTGTTSIRSQLKAKGDPIIGNPHLNIIQLRELIYIYLLKINLSKNSEFPARSVKSDQEIRQEAEKIFNSFFKFASVRNPWARAVSLYNRREGIGVSSDISFEEFCRNHNYASDTCIHPSLHKNQLDWITSDKGDVLVDFVYKSEESEWAMGEIEKLTNGRLKIRNIRENVNPLSQVKGYRDRYTAETKRIIERRFQKDIDYFKYSF